MRLTKDVIARLRLEPGKADQLFFDDQLAGYAVRLRAGGKRTFVFQYRLGQKQRRSTLGTVDSLTEPEARRRAKVALSKVTLGLDPQSEKAERRAQAARTVGAIVEAYLADAERRLKANSFIELRRYLTQYWKPIWEIPLNGLERADVAARLTILAGKRGGYAVNKARTALGSMFRWAIQQGIAQHNPVVGTAQPGVERPRERVLADNELALIWRILGVGDYADVVRLLILTGARREEIGGLTWDEIDFDGATWTLPGSRSKNRRSHVVPLSPTAIGILRARQGGGRNFVFGRKRSFVGWSKGKQALDARIEAAGAPSIKPWRLHDIRRTVATRLADLGVLPHVIEAILNHASGHKAGVAGIYNRATYAKEKREALNLWGEHLAGLDGGTKHAAA
jgi:integrase